jgi:6-phosphogluconolactonase
VSGVAVTQLAVVSCADSGELHVLALDPEHGTLSRHQVLQLGGTLMPLALHPSLPRLYVARRSEPLAVLTLAVHRDGTLAPLHEAALPASMAYLATDRSGRWLLSASYGGDCVAIGLVDEDGVAREAQQVLPTGRHAHCIVPDPANRFVHATALGADALHRFRLDAGQGTLVPTDPPTQPMQAGAGPRHLVFDASGTRAYLINELDAGLDVLACDPATRVHASGGHGRRALGRGAAPLGR